MSLQIKRVISLCLIVQNIALAMAYVFVSKIWMVRVIKYLVLNFIFPMPEEQALVLGGHVRDEITVHSFG